jgi:hypothetical protein
MVLVSGRRLGVLLAVALACGAVGAAAQSAFPGAVAAHLYWTNYDGSKVVEADLNGTHAKTIASDKPYSPAGIAVGDGHLYWVNVATGESSKATIVEADLNGTHAKTIARFQYTLTNGAVTVAVSNSHLYWTAASGIVEADLNGTDAKNIAKTPTGSIGVAVGGAHLYWGVQGPVSASSSLDNGKVVEADLNGTHAKTIAKDQYDLSGVAVGSHHLYWAQLEGRIFEADLNGTHAKTIAHAGAFGSAGAMAVGRRNLYWASTTASSTIFEADLNGAHAKKIVHVHSGILDGLAVAP